MKNELFFLPLVIDAFQQPDQKEALLQALQQIQEKGKQEQYQEGYVQFEMFMNDSESFAIESAMAEVESNVAFQSNVDESLTLTLVCDEQSIGSFNVGQQNDTTTFDLIKPGLYQLRMATGWVIWEEQLNEKELLWSQAFPNQPLLLAADTEGSQRTESKAFHLLDITITISIFPGPELGSLTVQYHPKGTDK